MNIGTDLNIICNIVIKRLEGRGLENHLGFLPFHSKILQISLMQLFKGLEQIIVFISGTDGVFRQKNIVLEWHIVAYIIEASICFLTWKKKKSLSNNLVFLFSSACVFGSGTNQQRLQLLPYPLAHAQTHTRTPPATQTSMNFALGGGRRSARPDGEGRRGTGRRGATAAHGGKQTDTRRLKALKMRATCKLFL